MNWRNLFTSIILARGKQYFQRGRVQDLEVSGANEYKAVVVGSCAYDVKIAMEEGHAAALSCDCPYAQEGNTCKHLAALFFAIEDMGQPIYVEEEKEKKNTNKKKTVKPRPVKGSVPAKRKPGRPKKVPEQMLDGKQIFTLEEQIQNDEEYRYFSMKQIAGRLKFKQSVCEAAQKLVADGMVILAEVNIGYMEGNARDMVGEAKGLFTKANMQWEVRIAFDRTHIIRAVCYVPGCFHSYDADYGYGSHQLCVHETALLYLLQKHLVEKNPGDTTDRYAMALIRSYRGRQLIHRNRMQETEEAASVQTVRLEPGIERTWDGFQATFRIGQDKLYVVKKLTELVGYVAQGEIMPLGKKGSIDFSTARFSDTSAPYFAFIRKCVEEEQERLELIDRSLRFVDVSRLEMKGAIPLFGERMDEFIDIVGEDGFVYRDETGQKSRYTCEEREPKVKLDIRKDVDKDGRFHGICLRGQIPQMQKGGSYYYYEDKEHETLCRVKAERLESLAPLLEMAEEGRVELHVGRKSLSSFYYTVLPALRECAEIREPHDGEIEHYLPKEAEYVFYLDADNRDVFCRAIARYGEVEYSLADRPTILESFRDAVREDDVCYYIMQYFPEVDKEKGVFHCGEDEDAIYSILESGIDRLLALGEVQSTERFRRLKIRSHAKVSVGVSVGSEIMNLDVVSEDISHEELLEILSGYKKKRRYYRLKSGDFLRMDDENLEALSDMMDAMHLSPREFVEGKMQIPIYRAIYLDRMLEEHEDFYVQRDANFRRLVKDFKTVKESDYEIPASLEPVMRNYQIYGHKWLRTLETCGFGGILADDMGLGKTLQMISVILASERTLPSLIVCPASLVYNWEEEFARFAPEIRVQVIAGAQEQRRELLEQYTNWDVLITSYDLLKRDIAEYEKLHFGYEVLDEAQYIKNHTTAAAKSVKIIRSRTRFALTGTPIENRLSELWSIFDYLMPGFLYGYDVFKRDMEQPITKNHDKTVTERLRKMVAPFVLRRLKGDVLKDLPEKMEEVRYARLESKQQRIYDGQVVHMQELVKKQTDENFQKNKLQILAELTKIRQICCDPELLLEDYDGGSAKREACLELVESAIEGEHKILLFSQFTSMLELLENDFAEHGISYYKITGATPKERRIELVKKFNEDSTNVFLISLKAGGTGLNLTGADVVIHYDPWWNVAAQNQATDRAHRIGQTKVVSVYKLIIKDSIEEKILKMQEEKKNLADEILSGEMGGLMNMNKEELLELLS